jgi:hypothetical protein
MNTTTNSNIIPYDDKELIAFEDDADNAINMLFMLCKSILLKDAKGTTSEVTYLGSQVSDEVF